MKLKGAGRIVFTEYQGERSVQVDGGSPNVTEVYSKLKSSRSGNGRLDVSIPTDQVDYFLGSGIMPTDPNQNNSSDSGESTLRVEQLRSNWSKGKVKICCSHVLRVAT